MRLLEDLWVILCDWRVWALEEAGEGGEGSVGFQHLLKKLSFYVGVVRARK